MNNKIISKKEKFLLLKQCIPVIELFLTKIVEEKFNNQQSHYKDALDAIPFFILKNFKYKHVFFMSLALAPYFIEIKNKVLKNELNLKKLSDPYYWENNKIAINEAIFFSATFIGELYKDEIEKDFIELEKLESVKDYFDFRNYIISKSENM
jgi:hypothetical protein